jgi:pyrroloquinoline quinone (PQQ) biosynthesis protein C
MTDIEIAHQWVSKFDADTARAVVSLVDCAAGDGGTLGYAQPMSPDEAEAFIAGRKRRVTTGEAHVLLGRVGGQPAFLGVLTCNGMSNCRHRAELSKGVVHPEFRGRRFVQLALPEMVGRAVELGVEQFVLDVREGSRAHVLWRRFGFESFVFLNDYARIGRTSHHGHFMVQSVASLSARLSATHTNQRSKGTTFILETNAFKEELRRVLHSHLTLAHPIFIDLFNPERRNLDLLRRVTLQGYQLTKHFLDYVERLFFHCPLPKFRRALLINVYEEETGRLSKTDNHVVLMQNFIRALGITDAQRDAMQPLPATKNLIDYRLAAVRDPARYHIGAAAVMIASEGQNLEVRAGAARHELLAKSYGLSEFDLQFFSVHQQEDVGHVEQGLNLVSELCTTETMQREALEAVDHTCRLFYAMYENMHHEFCTRPAALETLATAG